MRRHLCLFIWAVLLLASCNSDQLRPPTIIKLDPDPEPPETKIQPRPFIIWEDATGAFVGEIEPVFLDANGWAWWVDPLTGLTPARPELPGETIAAVTPAYTNNDCTGTAYIPLDDKFTSLWSDTVPAQRAGFPFEVVGQAGYHVVPPNASAGPQILASYLTESGCVEGSPDGTTHVLLSETVPGTPISAPSFTGPLHARTVDAWASPPPVWVDSAGTPLGTLSHLGHDVRTGRSLIPTWMARPRIYFDDAGHTWPIDDYSGEIKTANVSRVYTSGNCSGDAYLLHNGFFGDPAFPLPPILRLNNWPAGMIFYVHGVSDPRVLPTTPLTLQTLHVSSYLDEMGCQAEVFDYTGIAYADTLSVPEASAPPPFVPPFHLEPGTSHALPYLGWVDAEGTLVAAGGGRLLDSDGLLYALTRGDETGLATIYNKPPAMAFASIDCTGEAYVPLQHGGNSALFTPGAYDTPFILGMDFVLRYLPTSVTPVPLSYQSFQSGPTCIDFISGTVDAVPMSMLPLDPPFPQEASGIKWPLATVPMTIE
ncbi:MAG: hypothetical protein KDH09_12165 [Chrysiogenetes bacterium]|nr:hypothetical protein [Chrysiogenetes bacterium]